MSQQSGPFGRQTICPLDLDKSFLRHQALTAQRHRSRGPVLDQSRTAALLTGRRRRWWRQRRRRRRRGRRAGRGGFHPRSLTDTADPTRPTPQKDPTTFFHHPHDPEEDANHHPVTTTHPPKPKKRLANWDELAFAEDPLLGDSATKKLTMLQLRLRRDEAKTKAPTRQKKKKKSEVEKLQRPAGYYTTFRRERLLRV